MCRSRKVRCDGHFPCRRCRTSDHECAYLHAEGLKFPTDASSFQIQHLLDQPIENPALTHGNQGLDVAGPALQDSTILPEFSNCNGTNIWAPGAGLTQLDGQVLHPFVNLPVGPGWLADPDAIENISISTLLGDSANPPAPSSNFRNMMPREGISDYGDIRNELSSMQKTKTASISMLFSQYVSEGSLNIERCIERYFTTFHPLWPIVHKGTFGFKSEDAELIDSVVMIGAWESGVPSWMEAAIDVRPRLVSRILGKFVSLNILILCNLVVFSRSTADSHHF